ncbi:MAG: D-alanyl-D-alanine carboxypeptidase [Eubacterium sp.]|nr:D-alanyl-D-alanine carboxypeptidase [Eubacterium sp.]
MKRVFSLFLVLIMLVPMSVSAEEITKAETIISGVESEIESFFDDDVELSVSITPSEGGRKVKLERYDSEEKEYKPVSEFTTENAETATLDITVPENKRNRRSSWWKISVLENETARSAFFKFRITTKNIVEKELASASACIYCIEDKALIYDDECHERRKQASTTKIMTASLLIDSGKYNSITKVSKKAAKTPYGYLKMKVGDRYTNKSLLYALMLPSSNSAAVSIAEGVSGSTSKFVKRMNDRAKALGLEDTHFVTPHGLDKKNHYSSAYDISIIMADIYSRSSVFRKVISKRKYTFKTKKLKIKNTVSTKDKLKDYSSKHKGGKTGYTSGAGYCFCGVYKHGGKTYVVTVLGAPTINGRWSDMKTLYKYINKYGGTKY